MDTPTTPANVAAGGDEEALDHMYRREALMTLAKAGISKPAEADIKMTAMKLRMRDEAQQQQAQQAAASAPPPPPQPNLVAPPHIVATANPQANPNDQTIAQVMAMLGGHQ